MWSEELLIVHHCFVLNQFTNSCDCRQKNDDRINPPPRVFRLAGDPDNPHFFADIKISFKSFEAQMSTGQGECTISHHLAKWLVDLTKLIEDDVDQNASYMMVPITHTL